MSLHECISCIQTLGVRGVPNPLSIPQLLQRSFWSSYHLSDLFNVNPPPPRTPFVACGRGMDMEGKPCVIEKNHCQTMKGSNMNKICQELHMYIYIYIMDMTNAGLGLAWKHSTPHRSL